MVKARDDMRLVVGLDSNGAARPLRTDASGRLEIVNERSVHAAQVYNSTAISHATSGAWQYLTFNSELVDTDGMHSTASLTNRLTVVHAGIYVFGGGFEWAASATGVRGITVRLNGTTYLFWNMVSAVTTLQGMSISGMYNLAVGDYLELGAYQTSGGALQINAVSGTPMFWAARL